MDRHELFNDNQKLVYYCITKRFPNYWNDEDVKQNGFVGLWKACKHYDEAKSKFSTFAMKCIENQILLGFRKAPRGEVSLEAPVGTEGLTIGDTLDNMAIDGHEGVIVVADFINRLNDMQKEIIFYRMNGLTQPEISERVGLSQSYISRILIKIKALYNEI